METTEKITSTDPLSDVLELLTVRPPRQSVETKWGNMMVYFDSRTPEQKQSEAEERVNLKLRTTAITGVGTDADEIELVESKDGNSFDMEAYYRFDTAYAKIELVSLLRWVKENKPQIFESAGIVLRD